MPSETSLYILDTDSLSLYARGNEILITRCKTFSPKGLFITVITVEEQVSGWYDLIRRAKNAEQLERGYLHLSESIEMFSDFSILPFTRPAIERYENLKSLKLGVGKMDMRIAAIVLENNATLVTRNRRDFERIPALQIEDWTEVV